MNFVPMPRRVTLWRCPKCGLEKTAVSGPSPWIITCLPVFGRMKRPPVCPKCKVEMTEVKLFY